MRLFLTSYAAHTLDKIVPMLPKPPGTSTVAFIPTAADPYDESPWMTEDRDKLTELGFNVFDLDLKDITPDTIREKLQHADIIFVAGGNTFYLLEKARASGFDSIVRESVAAGVPYIGSSAGSMIAGPNIEPTKIFDNPDKAQLASTRGFGLVDFVVVPHYGKEKYIPYHERLVREYGEKYELRLITDKQFIYSDGISCHSLSVD